MLRRVYWYILADVSKDRNASIFRSVQSKKGLLDPEERISQLLHGSYLPSVAFPSQKTLVFIYVLLRTSSLSEIFCKRLLLLLLLLLLTAIQLSLGDSSPYTSTDKTNNNKYT